MTRASGTSEALNDYPQGGRDATGLFSTQIPLLPKCSRKIRLSAILFLPKKWDIMV